MAVSSCTLLDTFSTRPATIAIPWSSSGNGNYQSTHHYGLVCDNCPGGCPNSDRDSCLLVIGWLWNYVHVDRNKHILLWGGSRTTYGWRGFGETFSWLKKNTQTGDVLATAYDPMYYLYTGRKAVRPWIHRPETYFYPHGNATPDLGSVEEIRGSLEELGARFLVVNPLEGYGEMIAVAALFENLLRLYKVRPELVFESSDGLHRIYALPSRPDPRSVSR